MPILRLSQRSALALLLLAAGCTAGPNPVTAPGSGAPVLVWEVPRRNVHIDKVSVAGAEHFEASRRRWLGRLRAGGTFLPDGRPLFWSGTRDGVRTYFTLYPFQTWSDLEARAAATAKTQKIVGPEALTDYDSGDSALVPPHTSEIWARIAGYDYLPIEAVPLDERTARRGWIEFRQMPTGAGGQALDPLLTRAYETLAQAGYPLTCRAFHSAYGRGELVLLWLAPDEATLQAAASQAGELARRPDLAPLVAEIEALIPLRERIAIERRDDLSHLPDLEPAPR
jgi:hypothetical protein